jgi:hypothetical protein
MSADSILKELLECRRIAAKKFVEYDEGRKLKAREKAAWRAAEEFFNPKPAEKPKGKAA